MMDTPHRARLRAELEAAAAGLPYLSEGEHGFEFVFVAGAGAGWPVEAREAAVRLGAPAGERVGEVSIERFLAGHIEESDPEDPEAQRLRPRYEALRETLRRSLGNPRVVRVGEVEVACYLVGADEEGNLAGLRTVAVET